MGITAKEIARLVGKSVSTVYRSLGDDNASRIAPETRTRIRQIARTYGYQRHSLAYRLKSQKSYTVGFGIRGMAGLRHNPYFSSLVVGLWEGIEGHGYSLQYVDTDPGAEGRGTHYLAAARAREIDGLIVADSVIDVDKLLILPELRVPCVLLEVEDTGGHTGCVLIDYAAGMHAIIEHLASRGKRRPALLLTDRRLPFEVAIAEGLQQACADCGIELDPSLVSQSLPMPRRRGPREPYVREIERLLDVPHPPDALIVNVSLAAPMVFEVARTRGLQIPRDLAVVTLEDCLGVAEWTVPRLSALEQPLEDAGRRAGEMLLRMIEGRALESRRELVRPEFFPRESS